MRIKQLYSYKSPNQIWRILISETEKLLIETRDINSKEVFFNCFNLFSGKKVFKNLQLDEKFWIGIETFYNDTIIFHKFAKPDMPGHKEIISFDVNTKKTLWTNNKYSFLFILENKVYCFQQLFEGREFFVLDLTTGEEIENLGEDFNLVNDSKKKSESESSYDKYLFPLKYEGSESNIVDTVIKEKVKSLDIVGTVEYNIYENLLLMNFHSKAAGETLENKFYAIDVETGKEIFNDVLNSKLNAFVPDSFFVYEDLLFVLKEKNELITFKLE